MSRPPKAMLIGTGCLCSEAAFGCVGDDVPLLEALRQLCPPQAVSDWREIRNAPGYYPTFRAYGTTRGGEKVYVEVYDATTVIDPTTT